MEKILFLLILWMVLFSGGIFGAVYTEKRFETGSPLEEDAVYAVDKNTGLLKKIS